MLNRIKAGVLTGLLQMVLLVPPSVAHAAQAAWERPAPAVQRAGQAALLHVAVAGKRLVAVGERGLVLLSDDDGRNWTQSPTPVSVTLVKAFFVSPKTGWAVGHSGVVLCTDDGGRSWTTQLDGMRAARLAVEKYTGEIAGARSQGLAAAARQMQQDGADKPFFDVLFTDERNGFAVGAYGLIFRTEDGGKRWNPWMEHLDNPNGLHLYGMARIGASLFIAGEQGLLLRSTDGGRRFNSVATPYKGSYFGIVPLPGGGLYLYGLRGNLFYSADEGRAWTRIDSPSQASFSTGLALSGSEAVFANHAGQVFTIRQRAGGLQAISGIAPAPYTSVARAPDGAWVLTSMRGVARIEPSRPAGASPAVEVPK
ncbi:MAG TPA: YCF48-related protein [Noviherbaspirillum sp.]|nr:YCF48-related protein [Noviherbaspirillum sp.]